MKNIVRRSKLVSGICVTLAILSSGCSTVQRTPMAYEDLNYFQVDCRRKAEQIAMLQSMRATRDEKFYARMNNFLQPWQIVTDPKAYAHRQEVGYGRSDWIINQNLLALKEC